jgi:isoleucyl-tRNA synthetase
MPFITEHLWQNLVTGVCDSAPDSIFLAGWPAAAAADDELLDEVAEMRQVVELGRQARAQSRLRNRQPLPRLVVDGAPRAERHASEIADELRIKAVTFGPIEATDLRVRPNLPVLGPRLGAELGKIRKALNDGEFEALDGGRFRVAGHELEPDEVLVEATVKEGWVIAANEGVSVALDTEIDGELAREGRVNDTIHAVNSLRKESGLEIVDRIHLWLAAIDADLMQHAERIGAETLAVSVELSDGALKLEKAKV